MEKQKRSLLVSKQKYLKREEEFEKKAIKYSKAISAVAPGGTVDTLEQKVTVLNNQIRVSARIMPHEQIYLTQDLFYCSKDVCYGVLQL